MRKPLDRQLRGTPGAPPGAPAELRALLEAVDGALEGDGGREAVDEAARALAARVRWLEERSTDPPAQAPDAVSGGEALWSWTPDDRAWWSAATTAHFGHPGDGSGWSRDEWLDAVHPRERARIAATVEGALEGPGEGWTLEYRLRGGDGRWVPVRDHARISRCPDGSVRRVAGAVRERGPADAAGAESERQFRMLAETMAAATFIYRGTHFLYVNAAASLLTGYSRAEMLEIPFWDVVHPDHRALVRERAAARQRGEPVSARYEFKILSRDGEERWVDFTAGLIDYHGEPAVLGTAFDITRYKRAEAELRRQALTFANLYDAVVISDLAGRIVNWNPAAERMYGYTREEALGRTAELFLPADDADRVDRILEGLERDGRWTDEVRFIRKDGSEGISETVVVPLQDERGVRIGSLGVNRDVTERRRAERALRESESRFRLMVEGSEQVFFYVHDRDGVFEYLSPSVREVVGYEAEELVGRAYHVLLDGDESDTAVDENTQATLTGETEFSTYTAVTRHRDGRRIVLELVESAVVVDDVVVGVQGFARDITERVGAEDALRESEALYRTLFEDSRDAIYMTALDGTFLDANQAALDLFGYGRDELVSMRARDFYVNEADRERFQQTIARQGFVRDHEVRLRRRDGTVADCLLSATLRRDAAGRPAGYQGIIHDITERKRAEEQLAYGALHDALTGLPNRTLFLDRLEHAAARVQRGDAPSFAVLFLDLDRFKVVNDSLGHAVGDALLVAIAARLQGVLRPGDTVARFGGDEFTLLLDGAASATEASHVAERVLDALASPFTLERHEVFTSASVGIALAGREPPEPEELLRNADAALSRAKARGKARYEVFDRAMHAAALARLRTETDLRRALERGELTLFFQPVISLGSGRIVCAEALLRWHHPQRGMVPPGAFISLAEETGLIVSLGRWVIEEACRQAATWPGVDGKPGPAVGINLSAKQFAQPDLAEHVVGCFAEAGLGPERIKLEITESVILEEAEPARSTLAELRRRGVGLFLDDFGTGYSSLSYLHRFPIDALKVDRSFVSQMDGDPRSEQLVRAVVALARSLGVAVVAEGIETEAQLRALRELGCDYGQGFLFSRPVPADQVRALMSQDPRW